MKAPRNFQYLADPICIASLLLYTLNRYVLKPHHIGGWFTHGYLNDVLCLPLFVPITLYVEHLLRLRKHPGYPRTQEMIQSFLAFTIVFQLITPRFPHMFITAGDPRDILAYFIGGLGAGVYWHFNSFDVSHHRRRTPFCAPGERRPPLSRA